MVSLNMILSKVEQDLISVSHLGNLQQGFHEFEVRFGAADEISFDADVKEKNWQKVFDNFMQNGNEHRLIIDHIYPRVFERTTIKNPKKKDISSAIHRKSAAESVMFNKKASKRKCTIDNLRYSYNIERQLEKTENTGDLSLIRCKNRFSQKINEFFQIDMTIVDSFTRFKQFKKKEYMIEMELIKFDKAKIKTILKLWRSAIQSVFDVYFNLHDFMMYRAPVFPRSLMVKDLKLLKKFNYTVTDKADGERMFMIFFEKKIYCKNPLAKKSKFIFSNKTKTDIDGTIIDCEYLQETNQFLAFDLLICQNKDVREFNFDVRMKHLQELNSKLQELQELRVSIKTFYNLYKKENIFKISSQLWKNRDNFEYGLDGLIFTPVDEMYIANLQSLPVFKWKELITIDVRVEYIKNANFTYFHCDSAYCPNRIWSDKGCNWVKKGDTSNMIMHSRWLTKNYFLIKQMQHLGIGEYHNSRQCFYLGKHGAIDKNIVEKYDIVEYYYDSNLKHWVFLKKRDDKKTPNGYLTIKNNLQCIINQVSLEELSTFGDLRNSYDNIVKYYNETEIRGNWRIYNNFVKRKILQKVIETKNETHFHLDLGCGKLGDLPKYINNNFQNVLAIDESKNSLEEAIKRLSANNFVQKDYYWLHQNGLRITIVHADVCKNITNGECCLSQKSAHILQAFFKDKDFKGFDSISCMFTIHYFFGSEKNKKWFRDAEKTAGFFTNIKQLIKKNGLCCGIYINGDHVEKGVKFVENDKLLYEIKPLVTEEKSKLTTLQIRNECWGNVTKTEPMIKPEMLKCEFEKYGFEPFLLKNLNYYYNDFKKEFFNLTTVEKQICFVNDFFIFCGNEF